MNKPISKRTQKRLRQGAKTVEKSIKNLRPGSKKSGGKASVIAGTGVLVAAAAGAAVAVHRKRKASPHGAAFHVSRDGDHGWALSVEGSDEPIQEFRTKLDAVRAARRAAADAAPSDLMIHLSDGTIQAKHSYDLH